VFGVNALLSNLGLSAEQKALRKDAIGGSDANTIMGGDEKKLLRLWREKRGESEPEDLSDVLAVQMGSFTEPFNAAWFEKNTGYLVTCRGLALRGGSIRQPQPQFMACTLDGYVVERLPDTPEGETNGQEIGIFEAKHCGTRSTDAEIFARYVPQLTHNCLVAGETRAWLSVFKGNGDWVMFEYALDDAYAGRLIAAEEAFWNAVRTGNPPCAVPPEPTPKPVGVVEISMEGNNAWANYAGEYLETKIAADRHATAKDELKALVPAEASKCFGHGIEIRRDKRGSLRFYDGEE
jgi:predicted phage-related endonuclease